MPKRSDLKSGGSVITLEMLRDQELAEAKPSAKVDPLGVYLLSLSPGSRPAATWRLEAAATLLEIKGVPEWSRLTYSDLVALRNAATEIYSTRTASAILTAARRVCRSAWLLGLMPFEAYERLRQVEPIKGEPAPVGRSVPLLEIRALLEACGPDNQGSRDAALLALLFGCGLRRSEAVALKVSDVVDGGRVVIVRQSKNKKGRRVPLGEPTAAAVSDFARRLEEPGPLIRRVSRSDKIEAAGISGEAVRKRLARLCALAGIDRVSPHDCRRTYCTSLLSVGVDLAVVSRLLGHGSIQVTAGYDKRGALAEAEAASLFRFPYQLAD